MKTSISLFQRYLTRIEFIALPVGVGLYSIIVLTLNRGTTVDEGYYLLSYLSEQTPRVGVSDFDNIVKTLCGSLATSGNILALRWIRLIGGVFSILIFSLGSYEWLTKRYQHKTNAVLYHSFILISGTLTFAFGSNTLYYDNIQVILYLFVFGVYFLGTTKRGIVFWLLLILPGFFSVIAIMNYLMSGVLLIFSILTLELLTFNPKKTIKFFIDYFFGFFIGIIVYHLFISDIPTKLQSMINIISDSSIRNISGHDNSSIFVELLNSLFKLSVIIITGIIGVFLVYQIKGRFKKHLWVLISFIFLIVLILESRLLFFNFRSYVLIIPISLLLGIYFRNFYNSKIREGGSYREILIILLFIGLPYWGVFGTNQPLFSKIILYGPFWALVYFLLLIQIEKRSKEFNPVFYHIVFLFVFSLGYLYMAQVRKAHAYYSPKSSAYLLKEGLRYQDIKLSRFQEKYYANAIKALKVNGYGEGEKILAFYENFLTVYIVGGTVQGSLIYSAERFVHSPQLLENDRPKYILIVQYQEKEIITFLNGSTWNFPNSYNRIELGRSAQNLPSPEYNTLLFVVKQN